MVMLGACHGPEKMDQDFLNYWLHDIGHRSTRDNGNYVECASGHDYYTFFYRAIKNPLK